LAQPDSGSRGAADELVERCREAAAAFIRGDMRRYAELTRDAEDFTLFMPFGGPPRRGFDDSEEALDALAHYFRSGEADIEVVATHVSGGLPDRDWSLRVTLVFRREGGEWRLVHRHADAFVREITLEQLDAITRG
jgi:ketosteroid isomerase-like protein